MRNSGISRLLQFGVLVLLLAAYLTSQAQNNFEWKDASGKTRNLSELQRILREHKKWVESAGESGTQADLSDATLEGAQLSNAQLTGANLNGAHLRRANLSGAYLLYSKLNKADLTDANLNGAHLNSAELTDAHLTAAHLKHARLDAANLSGAGFFYARLNGAHLNLADLSGAYLYSAHVGRAFFEPKALPKLRGIAAATHLELLTYDWNPDALAQLRKNFENGGFREQERKITYALKRRETDLAYSACADSFHNDAALWSSDGVLPNCGSYVLNKAFFDWTCQYGMSPGRPLILGTALWLICSLIYFVCLQGAGETGLYRVYEQRLGEAPAAPRRFERISISSIRRFRGRQTPFQFLRDEWLLLSASMFFSLMSAFNIGFRDINFGRWLRLLTRQEFDIKAVGWARVVAGWQSLISVYLIALWVLTYFGRPFS